MSLKAYHLASLQIWACNAVCCMQGLVAPALVVYRLYREGTPHMRMHLKMLAPPHGYIMACLVVTIKMLYSLGAPAQPIPQGLPPAPDWFTWAQEVLNMMQGPLPTPADQEQVTRCDTSACTSVSCMCLCERHHQDAVILGAPTHPCSQVLPPAPVGSCGLVVLRLQQVRPP